MRTTLVPNIFGKSLYGLIGVVLLGLALSESECRAQTSNDQIALTKQRQDARYAVSVIRRIEVSIEKLIVSRGWTETKRARISLESHLNAYKRFWGRVYKKEYEKAMGDPLHEASHWEEGTRGVIKNWQRNASPGALDEARRKLRTYQKNFEHERRQLLEVLKKVEAKLKLVFPPKSKPQQRAERRKRVLRQTGNKRKIAFVLRQNCLAPTLSFES